MNFVKQPASSPRRAPNNVASMSPSKKEAWQLRLHPHLFLHHAQHQIIYNNVAQSAQNTISGE